MVQKEWCRCEGSNEAHSPEVSGRTRPGRENSFADACNKGCPTPASDSLCGTAHNVRLEKKRKSDVLYFPASSVNFRLVIMRSFLFLMPGPEAHHSLLSLG